MFKGLSLRLILEVVGFAVGLFLFGIFLGTILFFLFGAFKC